jgi:hypothetical protein
MLEAKPGSSTGAACDFKHRAISPELSELFLSFFSFFFFFLVFFETGFLCIVLAVLELTLWTRLASNSEIHLPLPPKCWD